MVSNSSAKKEFLSKTKQTFYDEVKKAQKEFTPSKELEGYGGSAIIGEKNYPHVATHNISNENISSSYQNTSNLVKKPYEEIFKAKAKNILGTTNSQYVNKPNEKITQEITNIYKAKKPITFASHFDKEIQFTKLLTNKVAGIMGSKNNLVKLQSTQNTSTSKKIEKYTQEDIKSREAIISLYEKGINEHQIINLLALGSFGVSFNKKLVPTKWAISVYDQTIEDYLHKKILDNSLLQEYEVYHYFDKGNYFFIILLPETFSGEIIESWDDIVERDYVDCNNKLNKKEPETAGGFWASKCAIHEYLYKRKKQASYISLRHITHYEIPLGVVFVRECIREGLKNKPTFKSSDIEEVKKYLKNQSQKHYENFVNSTTIKELKKQKKLSEFF